MKRIALALALCCTFGCCARGAAAADLTPIEVSTMPGDASAEVFYGVAEGFFRAEGLDVHVTLMSNVAAQAAAVSAGTVAIGNGGVGSIALARERGILERVIAPASVYQAKALTAQLMVAKNSALRKAADLNGKTVGTNGLQDQAHLESESWLEKRGADVKSIRFVEVPFPEMGAALERGRIDAALMVEPLITAASGSVQFFGDAMGAIAPQFISTGYFASDAWLAANPDVAHRFVRALLHTAVWANNHHAESAQILISATKLSPTIATTMTRSTYGTRLDPALMQPVIDMFVHFGVMRAPMPAQDVIWKASPAYRKR